MSNKIQRNFQCPCGSGKKFKLCCEPKPQPIAPRPAAAGGADLESAPKPAMKSRRRANEVVAPLPQPKVRGAFGRIRRKGHRAIPSTTKVIDPKFLSRAARERLHVSHT